jgi:hypothetical protein
MLTNTGNIDRLVRILLGLVLLWLAFTDTVGAWGYIGIVPLVTGVVGFCPLYALAGFHTSRSSTD